MEKCDACGYDGVIVESSYWCPICQEVYLLPNAELEDRADRAEEMARVLAERIDELEKENRMLRCEITGNPIGTDTWQEGKPCTCERCTGIAVESYYKERIE